MNVPRSIAALAAAACEAVAVVALIRGSGAVAVVLHAAASSAAAAALHRKVLEGSRAWSFALLFSAMLFIPVLGALGVAAVALTAPRAGTSPEPSFVVTRIPRPPDFPANRPAPACAQGPKARLDALVALRGQIDRRAVAALQEALEDPAEDVRLLAHALLESRARAISRTIEETSRALEVVPPERRGALHARLAREHWELAWLGLVQGECLEHALRSARRFATAALEAQPRSASLHFLLGRIDLRLGAAAQAESAFLRAIALGMPRAVAAPWLAEAAFLQRRYPAVRKHLEPATGGAALDRVKRYWA